MERRFSQILRIPRINPKKFLKSAKTRLTREKVARHLSVETDIELKNLKISNANCTNLANAAKKTLKIRFFRFFRAFRVEKMIV